MKLQVKKEVRLVEQRRKSLEGRKDRRKKKHGRVSTGRKDLRVKRF